MCLSRLLTAKFITIFLTPFVLITILRRRNHLVIINDYNFAILIISLLMRRILIQPHHRPSRLIPHSMVVLAQEEVVIRASSDETAI